MKKTLFVSIVTILLAVSISNVIYAQTSSIRGDIQSLTFDEAADYLDVNGCDSIQFKINGSKSSIEIIKTISTNDIIRIDLYNSSETQTKHADVVLDYIVKQDGNGKCFSTQPRRGLRIVYCDNQISINFNHKRSEIPVIRALQIVLMTVVVYTFSLD